MMKKVEPTEDEIIKVLSERNPERIESDELTPAGVLVPIFQKDGRWHLLLTRRTDTVDVHKGEISFPGGHMEPGDPDFIHTALREAEEEVGIPAEEVKILGRLDDIFTITRFKIRPVVGRIPFPIEFRPAPDEIDEIIILPLSKFMRSDNYSRKEYSYHGSPYPVYYFEVDGYTVWGATAKILKQFLELCMGFEQENSK